MKYKIKYRSLEQTLKALQNQARESIPYSYELTDGIRNPEDLFYYLKTLVTYKSDPPGIELIHSVPSLFEDNFHKVPGAGDCDCFTVLSLACLHCLTVQPYVVLAGNQKEHPTHIYTSGLWKKKYFTFDLTQNWFNQERQYKFRQILDTNL